MAGCKPCAARAAAAKKAFAKKVAKKAPSARRALQVRKTLRRG